MEIWNSYHIQEHLGFSHFFLILYLKKLTVVVTETFVPTQCYQMNRFPWTDPPLSLSWSELPGRCPGSSQFWCSSCILIVPIGPVQAVFSRGAAWLPHLLCAQSTAFIFISIFSEQWVSFSGCTLVGTAVLCCSCFYSNCSFASCTRCSSVFPGQIKNNPATSFLLILALIFFFAVYS